MKFWKKYGFILLALPLLTACDKVTCTEEGLKGFTGNWKWLSTDGGIANNIHKTPASTGTTMELQLTEDGHYRIFLNGALKSEGTYTTTTRKCIHDGKDKPWLQFSADPDKSRMVEALSDDMLLLSDEAYDGLTSKYARSSEGVK